MPAPARRAKPWIASVVCLAALAPRPASALDRDGVLRHFKGGWADVGDLAPAVAAPASRDAGLLPVHEVVVHLKVTQMAYALFVSRYQDPDGELKRYLGGANGADPATDDEGNVTAGAADEDGVGKNPFGDVVPQLNHFWDCRKDASGNRDYLKGLGGNDSGVNRAVKYWTGGTGIDGAYAQNWGKKGVRGEGAVALYKRGDKAKAFWYLGHVAHLLQDLTVPAHTLLYPHPLESDAYEAQGPKLAFAAPLSGSVEQYQSLESLFAATCEVSNDFDAGLNDWIGTDGADDRGRRRAEGFSPQELQMQADVLLPLAVRQTAALYQLFFTAVGKTPKPVDPATFPASVVGPAIPRPEPRRWDL